MPIHSHHLHFAVHHGRQISVSFLDIRRRREKLRDRGVTTAARGGMAWDSCLVVCELQADLHIPGLLVVHRLSHACSWCGPIGRFSGDTSNALRGSCIILPPRISSGPRNQNGCEMCCGKRETHQEAPDASSTNSAARKKSGRVVVRHFRDWLLCCSACRPSPRHLSLQGFLV